jgi:hypothetical protein
LSKNLGGRRAFRIGLNSLDDATFQPHRVVPKGAMEAARLQGKTMLALADKIAVVVLILGLVPKLDMEPAYNAAAAYAIEVGRTKEACLADENAEESTLAEARFRIEYDDSDID